MLVIIQFHSKTHGPYNIKFRDQISKQLLNGRCLVPFVSQYHMMWWLSTDAEACTNPSAYLQQIDRSNNVILVVQKGNLH
jgi:hypothetical protein